MDLDAFISNTYLKYIMCIKKFIAVFDIPSKLKYTIVYSAETINIAGNILVNLGNLLFKAILPYNISVDVSTNPPINILRMLCKLSQGLFVSF